MILANMLDDHQSNHKKRQCSFFHIAAVGICFKQLCLYHRHYREAMNFWNTSSIILSEKFLVLTHIQGDSNGMAIALSVIEAAPRIFSQWAALYSSWWNEKSNAGETSYTDEKSTDVRNCMLYISFYHIAEIIWMFTYYYMKFERITKSLVRLFWSVKLFWTFQLPQEKQYYSRFKQIISGSYFPFECEMQ